MICVDANVWAYFLNARADEHRLVRPRVRSLLEDGTAFYSSVIGMEVAHYLSGRLPDSRERTAEFHALDATVVADLEHRDVRRGSTVLHRHRDTGIGGRDAALVATMERADVSELWTHDGGLKRLGDELDWLCVTDPAT